MGRSFDECVGWPSDVSSIGVCRRAGIMVQEGNSPARLRPKWQRRVSKVAVQVDEAWQDEIASNVDDRRFVKSIARACSVAACDALYATVITYPDPSLEDFFL